MKISLRVGRVVRESSQKEMHVVVVRSSRFLQQVHVNVTHVDLDHKQPLIRLDVSLVLLERIRLALAHVFLVLLEASLRAQEQQNVSVVDVEDNPTVNNPIANIVHLERSPLEEAYVKYVQSMSILDKDNVDAIDVGQEVNPTRITLHVFHVNAERFLMVMDCVCLVRLENTPRISDRFNATNVDVERKPLRIELDAFSVSLVNSPVVERAKIVH